MSLLMLMASVNAVFGQMTKLTAGGKLASGSYYLSNNLTITTPITVASGNTVTIDLNGYVLCGNFTSDDYVLKVESRGKLTINDSNPTVGHAGSLDKNGVFIWGTTGSTMTVSGGIIYCYQKTGKSTRGISVSGECIVEKAKIMGCYSQDIGAAVTVTSSGKFTMNSGEIRYNYSKGDNKETRAGVIYGEPSHGNTGSVINISNTIISDNRTEENGGAILGYNVTLNNCTIERNSTAQNGGAIYMRRAGDSLNDGSLRITSCNINDNSAINGGAIFADTGVTITIDGTASFTGNKATSNGGAIYAGTGVTTTIGGAASFISNEATSNGGGIYVSELHINGEAGNLVQFKKNTANVGGGIYVVGTCNIDYCNLESNYVKTNGGGIYAKSTTNISNSYIKSNRAMSTEPLNGPLTNKGRGGGFFFSGKTEDLDDTTNPVFTLRNTHVTYNACMYYGGGGHIENGATLNLNDGSTINSNESVLHGAGGLHVTATARFNFNDGHISYNKAYTVGGAIHSSYGCELNFNGGVIQGNESHQRGGGVHINTGGVMLLKGTQIIGNRVSRGFDMKYCEVVKNSDGTYSWNPPVAEKVNSSYKLDPDGNVEFSGYGGGVLIDSGVFTMDSESGLISGNSAEIGGGGVALVMIRVGDQNEVLKDSRFYNYKVAEFNLIKGSIINNVTTGDNTKEDHLEFEIGNGAGVYIMENRMKAKLGDKELTMDEWKAKSGFTEPEKYQKYLEIYNGVSTANISGGSINNNQATGRGGGLFLQAGNVDMNNFSMSGNTAAFDGGGLYLHNGELTIGANKGNVVSDNEANNGGGVCIANGTLSIEYCNIQDNTAKQYGGGVYVSNTESIEIDLTGGGVFANNTALAGGGMAVGGNILLNFEGSIQNNTADNGGGIYLLPGAATLNYKGGFIRNNVATGTMESVKTGYHGTVSTIHGFGGGAFLEAGTTFKTEIKDKDLGFYGNLANVGADDIFANGNNTTVVLPSVDDMELSQFDVPTTELFWVEDYVADDIQYVTNGSNMIAEGTKKDDNVRRYRESLRRSLPIYKVTNEYFDDVQKKYLCLALGYKILYMTIKKTGLNQDESAVFNVYDTKNALVSMALLRGEQSKKEEGVTQMVAVPEGEYKVMENSWSWNYNLTEVLIGEEKAEAVEGKYVIQVLEDNTDLENTITFKNTIVNSNKKEYDEAIKVNRMGSSTTTTNE